MNDNESTAQTVIAICRQYLDRCCAEPLAEHLAIELAGIIADTALSETVRRDAFSILKESRQ